MRIYSMMKVTKIHTTIWNWQNRGKSCATSFSYPHCSLRFDVPARGCVLTVLLVLLMAELFLGFASYFLVASCYKRSNKQMLCRNEGASKMTSQKTSECPVDTQRVKEKKVKSCSCGNWKNLFAYGWKAKPQLWEWYVCENTQVHVDKASNWYCQAHFAVCDCNIMTSGDLFSITALHSKNCLPLLFLSVDLP